MIMPIRVEPEELECPTGVLLASYTVICEGCGYERTLRQSGPDRIHKSSAVVALRQTGWLRLDDLWFCPACLKRMHQPK